MQISSRLLLVHPILSTFSPPLAAATRPSVFYCSMLLAWSVTEIIRYSYFMVSEQRLRTGVPEWLVWLRYSAFFLMYPLGIGSEWVLLLKASFAAGVGEGEWAVVVQWALWGVLAVYVPGSYVLFTHMMAQRRKVMRGKGIERR